MEAEAEDKRLAKRRRISERGESAARAAQEEPPLLMPTQPISSWDSGVVPGSFEASGPPKDAVRALVAQAAALATAVSPSSNLLVTC